MYRRLFFAFCLLTLAGCGSGETLFIPDGNPMAGKIVFSDPKCYSCPEVEGEDFPSPSAISPTFVSVGKGSIGTRAYLVESIIAPSHRFATPRPPAGQSVDQKNILVGSRSRMKDFSAELSVREMLDLVAYLESLNKM